MDANKKHEYPIAVVPGLHAGRRIDVWLSSNFKNHSRSSVKKLCEKGFLLVNGKPVKANHLLKAGDAISFLSEYATLLQSKSPVHIPIDILYEDACLLIANKPSGMPVHPGLGNHMNSLYNAVAFHLGDQAEFYLAHRLDKYTSGPVLVARTKEVLGQFQHQFTGHSLRRTYHCLVLGQPHASSGTIENFIGRDPSDPKVIRVSEDGSFGKLAITHYEVLRSSEVASWVKCRIETGRTHQIRVHMQHLQCPLIHDARYDIGSLQSPALPDSFPSHYFLHAENLEFIHPVTNENMRIAVPFPDDFNAMVHYLFHDL
jgi:23S rRNA pseudouridine1911/1915/1917 synthase